jgi:hypothetical protein
MLPDRLQQFGVGEAFVRDEVVEQRHARTVLHQS